MNVGVIGCGAISGIYFQTLSQNPGVHLLACSDLDPAKAQAKAEEFRIPRVLSTEELLNDAEVEVILNLTIPRAHHELNLAALKAGKHVYSEKPLGVSAFEAEQQFAAALAAQRQLACAPDTILGAGIQTAMEQIRRGAIGQPVFAQGFMLCPGHESWHPSPAFYYDHGGGPMLDMGPYYVSALVALLGPATRVTASTKMTHSTRTITSEPLRGTEVPVHVATHQTGVIDFVGGATAALTTSFDVPGYSYPPITVFGTEGVMEVPDPNTFGGPVRVRRQGSSEWNDILIRRPYAENSRGIGLIDLVEAVKSHTVGRLAGEFPVHVTQIMEAFDVSSREGKHIWIKSQPSPILPMPEPVTA